jgi:hypothetical protein
MDVAMSRSRRPKPGTAALEQEITDRGHQNGSGADRDGCEEKESFQLE